MDDERQQRIAERIMEDESLAGDLEDPAAKALIEWALQQAAAATADPARPDEAVQADAQAIRAAARAAARSGAQDPQQVVARAEVLLAQRKSAAPAAERPPVVEPAAAPHQQPAEPAADPVRYSAPVAAEPAARRREEATGTGVWQSLGNVFKNWLMRLRKDRQ
jgi:hypothetical protein